MKTPVIGRDYYTLPRDDLDNNDLTYEITWAALNGDWSWLHTKGLSFQGACRYGLSLASPERRLVSVNRINIIRPQGEQS